MYFKSLRHYIDESPHIAFDDKQLSDGILFRLIASYETSIFRWKMTSLDHVRLLKHFDEIMDHFQISIEDRARFHRVLQNII